MKPTPLAALVLAGFLAGCAADSAGDVTDEGTAEATADLNGKVKHHYTPGIQDVTWHPGCGVVRPDSPPCPMGLTMTFTLSYADLTFTHAERVNNGNHTLTITVDSWSYSTIHPMIAVHPQTISLSPDNLQMSTHYSVVVKDRQGQHLWTGDIATYLAM
jgi:hypothetical protein